jgi:hypothetical protein
VLEVGTRRKNQPPPPHVVFEALTQPDRDPDRRWLALLSDEQRPQVLVAEEPHVVIWSSLWPRCPGARVRFDLHDDADGSGTGLRWTLLVEEPAPTASLIGHMRKRLTVLSNAELRYSFGS